MGIKSFQPPGEALTFSHALYIHLLGEGPPVHMSCGGSPDAAHPELEQNLHA